MKKGTYTSTHSDLYYKIYAVHHIGEDYVKVKAGVFYKSNNDLCRWLCPHGPKNFKLIKSVVDNWEIYDDTISN